MEKRTTPQPERRMVDVPIRVETRDGESGEPRRLVGYAAVFNVETNIGGWFRERIRPGAFRRSIERGDDVRALWNHDPSHVLGRTKSGTLTLREDERGLLVEIIPPDTQLGRDLVTLVERGDVSQMSFGFVPIVEEWESRDGQEVRTLVEVDLFDVSLVTFPAYDATSISARDGTAAVAASRRQRAVRAAHHLRRLRLQLADKE